MTFAEILLVLLIVIVVAGLVAIYLKLSRTKSNGNEMQVANLLQNQLAQMMSMQNEKFDRVDDVLRQQNKMMSEQLAQSQTTLQKQFAISQQSLQKSSDSAQQIIKEVTEKLTKLDETNKQVVGFAGQLQSLEKILKNPKQRGVLGEYFLENVLKNVLPPGSYQMQYKFLDGEIVDSVVFVKDKIIPIDSKFSLENYNRIVEETDDIEKEKLEKIFKQDLKNRIEETAKYIRPEEGTMDFAFMFIPSEGIYYDLLVNKVGAIKINTVDLINYAFSEKKVIIVSPTSFLAYLQTVMQGLRALQIEESAKQILTQVSNLKKHLDAFDDQYSKLGKHLGTAVGAYNTSFRSFKGIDRDLFKLTGENLVVSAEEVDRPMLGLDGE